MGYTQEEKVLSGLAHVAVLFGLLGLAYNVVIYLVKKPQSAFVADHAKQGIGFWLIWYVAGKVVGLIFGAGWAGFAVVNPFSPTLWGTAALAGLLMGALGLAVLVLVIMAAIKGFNGQTYRYPIIGDFVAGINF